MIWGGRSADASWVLYFNDQHSGLTDSRRRGDPVQIGLDPNKSLFATSLATCPGPDSGFEKHEHVWGEYNPRRNLSSVPTSHPVRRGGGELLRDRVGMISERPRDGPRCTNDHRLSVVFGLGKFRSFLVLVLSYHDNHAMPSEILNRPQGTTKTTGRATILGRGYPWRWLVTFSPPEV